LKFSKCPKTGSKTAEMSVFKKIRSFQIIPPLSIKHPFDTNAKPKCDKGGTIHLFLNHLMMYPSHYKYTRDHLWVNAEDGVAVVGLTEFAQKELGEVVFVELPEVGQVVQKEDKIGSVESVKTLIDLLSPLSGSIKEPNESVTDDPELLNKDPYNEGWLVKINYTNASELNELMNNDQYKEHLKSEGA
jgi:glycine cleavage system H protein